MRRALALALIVGAVFVLNHRILWEHGKSLDSYHGRLVAWRVGIEVWWEQFRLFGAGTNGWHWFIPQWADRFKALGAHEAFLNAHSLLIQLLFEQGIVGLALVGMVAWSWRWQILRSPPAIALLILSAASFPLFLAQVAAPALVAVALTWRRHEARPDGRVSADLGGREPDRVAGRRVGGAATRLRADLP